MDLKTSLQQFEYQGIIQQFITAILLNYTEKLERPFAREIQETTLIKHTSYTRTTRFYNPLFDRKTLKITLTKDDQLLYKFDVSMDNNIVSDSTFEATDLLYLEPTYDVLNASDITSFLTNWPTI